jgi:hypothetical protein
VKTRIVIESSVNRFDNYVMPPPGTTLIEFILRYWVVRVINDLDDKGIAPAPWHMRQAIAWCNEQLLKLHGETAWGEEGDN